MNELREHLKKKFNLSDEQYNLLVQERKDKSTTKKDLDNLGMSQVNTMKKLKELEDRIAALEGGTI